MEVNATNTDYQHVQQAFLEVLSSDGTFYLFITTIWKVSFKIKMEYQSLLMAPQILNEGKERNHRYSRIPSKISNWVSFVNFFPNTLNVTSFGLRNGNQLLLLRKQFPEDLLNFLVLCLDSELLFHDHINYCEENDQHKVRVIMNPVICF